MFLSAMMGASFLGLVVCGLVVCRLVGCGLVGSRLVGGLGLSILLSSTAFGVSSAAASMVLASWLGCLARIGRAFAQFGGYGVLLDLLFKESLY